MSPPKSKIIANSNGHQSKFLENRRNIGKASPTTSTVVDQKIVSYGRLSRKVAPKKSECDNKIRCEEINGKCTDIIAAKANPITGSSQPHPNRISEPQANDARLTHANKGIVALSVLVQYLTFDVSAVQLLFYFLLLFDVRIGELSVIGSHTCAVWSVILSYDGYTSHRYVCSMFMLFLLSSVNVRQV